MLTSLIQSPCKSARIVLGIYVAGLALLALAYTLPMPYADHFSIYMILRDMHEQGMAAFFSHAASTQEHWTFSVYAILLSLAELTGWNLHAETCAMLLMLAASAWFLWKTLQQSISPYITKSERWKIWLPLLLIVFSYTQFSNLIWGLMMFGAAALLALYGAVYFLAKTAPSWRDFIFGVGFTLFGIYGYSPSFALLPAGAFLLASIPQKKRAHWWMLGLWLLLSLVLLAQRSAHSQDIHASHDVLGYIQFTLLFLGGAISRFAEDVCMPLVVVGSVLTLTLLWQWARRDWRGMFSLSRPFIALMVYSAAAGFLYAYGRLAEFGVEQALVARYMASANPFWIGVFGIMLSALVVHPEYYQRAVRLGLLVFIALCFALFIGNSIQHVKKHIRLYHHIAEVKQRVIQHAESAEDEDFIFAGYRPPLTLREIADDLQANHMGGF